jgi:hypothetical protein
MAKRSNLDHGLLLVIVGTFAWFIPGAGHFFIKEKKRAIIIFVTITATFLMGLYIGSIGVIDRVHAGPWYLGQVLTSPAVAIIGAVVVRAQAQDSDAKGANHYRVYAKPHDYGQIYTAIAGGLNLLCILNAVYMAHSGRGELIGSEEDGD